MQNIPTKQPMLRLKAFTLLESLLVLALVSFIGLSLSSRIQASFQSVRETIFFLEFEGLYTRSQQLAAAGHQTVGLDISPDSISNGYQEVVIPEGIQPVTSQTIVFQENGGNSSLAKLTFQTHQGTVTYQLYLGSGRYKKTEH